MWRYEPFVDDFTDLMVGAEYNAQTTLSRILAKFIASVKPIVINFAMFMNPLSTNAVKTALIHCWWYEDIARIDPPQRKSDLPRAYISLVYQSPR